jgi:two-component system nitrate/nitrite response regulator NarL
LREGLRDLLEENAIDVVGEAADGSLALDLSRRLQPDVVVMDIAMPGMSGIEATRRVHASLPSIPILMLTVSADDADVGEAVHAGACGYVLKDADPEQIVAAVRAAAAGESLLSPRIAAPLLERWRAGGAISSADASGLTARELDVLRLMAEGKDNAAIAGELQIGVQTVKSHVSNVLVKLEVENRVQAAVHAVRRRLV